MLRKTIFIAIVVAVIFLLYRGINPTWADQLVNKISSIREKNTTHSETWSLNTWNTIISWMNTSWDNSYEKLIKSGSIVDLTWKNEEIISTWNKTNTGNNLNTKTKTITTTKATPKKVIQTNTNWLSNEDLKDISNLLNNIVE